MRKLLLTFSGFLIIVNPVIACPILYKNKDQFLSELCNIDDGKWSSNRLNEMIILNQYDKLPQEASKKSNRILAGLICRFREYKN